MAPRTHLWKCFCDIFWIILNAGWYNTVAVMGLPQNVRIELLATRRCPKLEYIFKVSIVLFTLFEDNNWKFLPLPKKIFLTLRVCTGQGTCTCNGHYYTYFLHVGTYIHCNVGTYMQKVITTPNHHHLPCVDGLGKGYRRVVCVWYDLTYNSDGHP